MAPPTSTRQARKLRSPHPVADGDDAAATAAAPSPPQNKAPVHEAAITGAIVVSSVVSLAFGIAAVATPNWHYTDSAAGHVRRGLFEVCSVESIDGVRQSFCQEHSMGSFCGHSISEIRNRFIWPPGLALLSLVLLFSIPFGASCSWFLYRPRPKTLLVVSGASLVFMLMAMTIHVYTLDAWYFCNKEFCDFARAELLMAGSELCLSGMGYSFVLALLYCAGIIFVMVCCALYSRWLRLGVIHDGEALHAAAKKQQRRLQQQKDEDDRRNGRRHNTNNNDNTKGGGEDNTAPVGSSSGPPALARGVQDPSAAPAPPTEYPARMPQDPADGAAEEGGGDVVVDDWVFDASVGMHWSAYLGLYLDPRTQRFFDPQSDCWHDPESDEWYRSPSRW